jgi:hypothetical protein
MEVLQSSLDEFSSILRTDGVKTVEAAFATSTMIFSKFLFSLPDI